MAEGSNSILSGKKFSAKLDVNFEDEVKCRMSWSKDKWAEEGEENSRLQRLVNSLKFWGEKLKRAERNVNVILTVFNTDKNALLCMEEMFDAIDNLDKPCKIIGFVSFRNPRYISVTFETTEMKEHVEKNLKYIGENNVAFLSWASEASHHTVRVHWLPIEVDIVLVRNLLKDYFELFEEMREISTFLNGRKVKSGIINFKARLKENVSVEAVPHLAIVDELECLITIPGRKYMCLNCNVIGHKSYDCPTPYCGGCKKKLPRSHECGKSFSKIKTYAQTVTEGDLTSDVELTTDWKNCEAILKADKIYKIKEMREADKLDQAEEATSSKITKNTQQEKKKKEQLVTKNNIEVLKQKRNDESGIMSFVACEKGQTGWNEGQKIENLNISEGSSESEGEDFQDGSDVIANMHSYFEELKTLQQEVGSGFNRNLRDISKIENKLPWSEQEMEVGDSSLKRKMKPSIDCDEAEVKEPLLRRTYGRRGGRKAQRSAKAKSENLFELSIDKVRD